MCILCTEIHQTGADFSLLMFVYPSLWWNPVKWQQCSLLLLSLMFFFNLALSFHLPPPFAQLLRELTCCWKRYFRADLGRVSTRGAVHCSHNRMFSMTTALLQLQFNKAKPKSGWKVTGTSISYNTPCPLFLIQCVQMKGSEY